jgi:hypothetical protein
MGRTLKLVTLAAGLFLTARAAPSDAGRQLLLIRSGDATAHTEADTSIGRYYTLAYPLPEALSSESVELAMLELYIDVRAKVRDGYVNEAPVLEVYALTEAWAGAVDPAIMDWQTGAVRPVALGEDRRVLLDVTDIVRAHLAGRVGNHGLILGSITGRRDGDFRLVSGALPGDGVGQLRLYTRAAAAR